MNKRVGKVTRGNKDVDITEHVTNMDFKTAHIMKKSSLWFILNYVTLSDHVTNMHSQRFRNLELETPLAGSP